jgi:hypothetical protein
LWIRGRSGRRSEGDSELGAIEIDFTPLTNKSLLTHFSIAASNRSKTSNFPINAGISASCTHCLHPRLWRPQGLYKRARSGEIANFTGISSPYEPPSAAELTIETDKMHVEACVAKIVGYVEHHLRLPDRASI